MHFRNLRLSFGFIAMTFILITVGECRAYIEEDDDHPRYNETNEVAEKSFTWLKGAQDMFASPTGHVVVQVAKELLNRSAGNSQVRSEVVLSLNLTNLIVILLLKVLIFAAAMLGAGHWSSGYGYGYNYRAEKRSNEGFSFGLRDGEDYLITGFLAAQGSGSDDCLYAAACSSPQVAYEYARAAKALLDGIEKFEGESMNNPRYNDLIVLMEKGAHDGLRQMPCNTSTQCNFAF